MLLEYDDKMKNKATGASPEIGTHHNVHDTWVVSLLHIYIFTCPMIFPGFSGKLVTFYKKAEK